MSSQSEVKPKRKVGAPTGNQNGIGNSGRPPKTDLPAMAKALEEWSKRDDAVHFAEFSLEYDEYPQRLYEWRDKSIEFAEAFIKARARIAIRLRKKLHDKSNPYNYGLFMREIGMYDKELDAYEDSKELFRASAKAKAEAKLNISPDQQKMFDSFIEQVKALHSQSSNLTTEDSSKSTESKS